MIKFKKILAIALCIVMSFTSFVVFADETVKSEETSVYPEIAIELGIFDSTIKGRLDKNITRGELVGAIVRMRGVEGSYKEIFTDVTAEHPYAKEISCAYDLGYINGFGDGTFRPDEEATYSQLVKLLVYLAGYEEAVKNGMSVETAAVKSKISRNIQLSNSPSIKVRELCQILVNVGEDVEVLDISSVTNGGVNYSQNGNTIFNSYLNIYKKDAIITANASSGIYEETSLGEGMIAVDDEKMLDSSKNAQNLLGANVTAYIKRTKNSKPELLYAYANEENDIIKIPAINIYEFKNGVLYYEDEDGEDEEAKVNLTSVAVIYNGVLTYVPSINDFNIETGDVELIDNNNDKKVDVVKINKYENFVIDSYDKTNDTLWFKFGAGNINFNELDNVEFSASDGKPIDASELFEWDVVSISKSKKSELVKVIYVTGEIEGKVSAKYSKDEKKIEIDGVTYDVSKVFIDNLYDEIYVGLSASFYLDIEGKVASYNLLGYSDKEFFYLAEIKSGTKMDIDPKIKFMDKNGNVKILPLASKVELDGVKKVLKNEADMKTLEDLASQVFIGKVNSKGELYYIDTVKEGPSNGLKVLNPKTKMRYKKNTMIFYNESDETQQVPISKKTIYMYVPSKPQNASDDDYYIQNVTSFANDKRGTFIAYTDGDGVIADVLMENHTPGSTTSFTSDDDKKIAPCVINEVSSALNKREEVSYKISVFNSSGNFATYYTESDNILFEGIKVDGVEQPFFPQQGDIVKIKTNRYGEIKGIKLVYRDESSLIDASKNPNDKPYSEYRIQVAYAYNKEDNVVLTTTTKPQAQHKLSTEGLENLEPKNLSVYKVCVYDSKQETVTKGDDSYVRDFISTGGLESSKLFIYERYLETGMICIIK